MCDELVNLTYLRCSTATTPSLLLLCLCLCLSLWDAFLKPCLHSKTAIQWRRGAVIRAVKWIGSQLIQPDFVRSIFSPWLFGPNLNLHNPIHMATLKFSRWAQFPKEYWPTQSNPDGLTKTSPIFQHYLPVVWN